MVDEIKLMELGYVFYWSRQAWVHPEYDSYTQYGYDSMDKLVPIGPEGVAGEKGPSGPKGPAAAKKPTGAVKSDGGSSSYYTLNINGNKVETEEIIEQVFGNDFDFGNAFKSLIRAYLNTKGKGKAGNDLNYELNKIKYSINKIKGRK